MTTEYEDHIKKQLDIVIEDNPAHLRELFRLTAIARFTLCKQANDSTRTLSERLQKKR